MRPRDFDCTIRRIALRVSCTFGRGDGRLVFRASWQRLASDFDFRQGGLLAIGMAVLFFAPLIAAKLRGLI